MLIFFSFFGGTYDFFPTGVFLSFVGAFVIFLPSFTIPNKAPTSTVSPSLNLIDDNVPFKGDGTSTFTLSVSSSTRGSST